MTAHHLIRRKQQQNSGQKRNAWGGRYNAQDEHDHPERLLMKFIHQPLQREGTSRRLIT
jgi:hypothetical protein